MRLLSERPKSESILKRYPLGSSEIEFQIWPWPVEEAERAS